LETGNGNLTANVILNELSKNEEVKKIIWNIASNDPYLKDELFQEVFIILYSKEPRIIEKKHHEGFLIGYTIGIARKQFNKSDSGFNRKIENPRNYTDLDSVEIAIKVDTDEFSEKLEDLKDVVNQMKCCPRSTQEAYHSTILQAYLNSNCNITAAARSLNINKNYVRESLKFTKARLKEELLKNSDQRNNNAPLH
jgi:hypothetical protein